MMLRRINKMEYKVKNSSGIKLSVFIGNGLAIFLPTIHLMIDIMRAYLCLSFNKVTIELGKNPLRIKYG